jgi:hypothetical protein
VHESGPAALYRACAEAHVRRVAHLSALGATILRPVVTNFCSSETTNLALSAFLSMPVSSPRCLPRSPVPRRVHGRGGLHPRDERRAAARRGFDRSARFGSLQGPHRDACVVGSGATTRFRPSRSKAPRRRHAGLSATSAARPIRAPPRPHHSCRYRPAAVQLIPRGRAPLGISTAARTPISWRVISRLRDQEKR